MSNENKIIFAIIILAAVIGMYKRANVGVSEQEINDKRTSVNQSIDTAEKSFVDKVDDVVKCECGGTGYITHGDGHQTPCPAGDNCEAKKKSKTKASDQMFGGEEKHGVIYFYTLPGCAPCLKWKNEVKPWVEASDWNVEEFRSEDAAPWFEVWIRNQPYVYKGFMSKEAFKEIVKNAK